MRLAYAIGLCGVLFLGGCVAVGEGVDPATGERYALIGVKTSGGVTEPEKLKAAATAVGGLVGGPTGAAVAGAGATLVLSLLGLGHSSKKRREAEVASAEKQGAERGWDEAIKESVLAKRSSD